MARLRDSWRTSLPASRMHRIEAESIARSPYKIASTQRLKRASARVDSALVTAERLADLDNRPASHLTVQNITPCLDHTVERDFRGHSGKPAPVQVGGKAAPGLKPESLSGPDRFDA